MTSKVPAFSDLGPATFSGEAPNEASAWKNFMTAFADSRLDGVVHMNNAGLSPLCAPAVQAMGKVAQLSARRAFAGEQELFGEWVAAREPFAKLLGVDSSQVAMTGSCAAAISTVALGIDLRRGDEIVSLDQEYPSNVYPWFEAAKRTGAEYVAVPSGPRLEIDLERLLQSIGPRTRVVTVSWVQYQSGAVLPLRQIAERARSVGAWMVVDAIQGLGVLPFDLRQMQVDAVCGGTHKWMCSILGHGFLGLAAERVEELRPVVVGAMTYGGPGESIARDKVPLRNATRFEPGTPAVYGTVAGAAALNLLHGVGIPKISARAIGFARRLAVAAMEDGHEVLGHAQPHEPQSPIVTLRPRAGSETLTEEWAARLQRANVTFARRAGGIRLSPHAFNTDEDIDLTIAALRDKKT